MANPDIEKLLRRSKKELDSEYDAFEKAIKKDLKSFKKKTLDRI